MNDGSKMKISLNNSNNARILMKTMKSKWKRNWRVRDWCFRGWCDIRRYDKKNQNNTMFVCILVQLISEIYKANEYDDWRSNRTWKNGEQAGNTSYVHVTIFSHKSWLVIRVKASVLSLIYQHFFDIITLFEQVVCIIRAHICEYSQFNVKMHAPNATTCEKDCFVY